jgi:hypothetical protein
MGLTQAEGLARDPGCGVAERERLIAGLADLGTPAPGLDLAAMGESTYTADLLKKIKAGEVDPSYLYHGFDLKQSLILLVGRAVCYPNYFMQYNRTWHLMADDLRLLIAHASSSYADHPLRKRDSALIAIGRQGMIAESGITGQRTSLNRDHLRHLPYSNTLGHRLWHPMADVMESLVITTCRQKGHLSAIRLLLACRAYEEATGRLPETLEALVPGYLPAVPCDPFDGAPFRYSAERGLLYSVGANLVDDGGTDGRQQGRRRAKDLVFELER